MLCDYAQVADGKMTIVGGGWNELRSPMAPISVAALLHLPWQEKPREHHVVLELIDEDGRQVMDTGGSTPVRVEAGLAVEGGDKRPDRVGVPIPVPFACVFGPLGLEGGKRYVWRLFIDEETSEEWQASFLVSYEAQ